MAEPVLYNTTSDTREPFVLSADFYDAIYAARGKDYAAEATYLIEVAARTLNRPPRSWLDVACGTGEHLRYLREHVAVVGVDDCPAMLAVARRKLPATELVEGDMQTMALGRRFEVVSCLFASVAYLPNEAAMAGAIATMAEHLNPGGVLLLEPGVMQGQAEPPRVDSMCVTQGGMTLRRQTSGRLEAGRLIITFEYESDLGDRRRTFREEHVVQLFTREAYENAMATAGLTCEFDLSGPARRGLFIGRSWG